MQFQQVLTRPCKRHERAQTVNKKLPELVGVCALKRSELKRSVKRSVCTRPCFYLIASKSELISISKQKMKESVLI